MYRIVNKEALKPTVILYEIEAPMVAKKAQPGQFIILRVDEDGERIPLNFQGYFADKAIRRLPLPSSRMGENVLTVKMPLTARKGLEACYLLGDFELAEEWLKKSKADNDMPTLTDAMTKRIASGK